MKLVSGVPKEDVVGGEGTSKKKKEAFYIVKYTNNKEKLAIYPEIKNVVKAVDARIKELILPNLKRRSITQIYIQHNVKMGHVEYPKYKFMFSIQSDDKKYIVYMKTKHMQKLIVALAKKYSVNNVESVFGGENIIITFRAPCVSLYSLFRCCSLRYKPTKKVMAYFSYDLDADGTEMLYTISSKFACVSFIMISHSEKYDEKIEDRLVRV